MKKLLLSLFMIIAITLPSSAATWVAADRVPTVGKKIITANSNFTVLNIFSPLSSN